MRLFWPILSLALQARFSVQQGGGAAFNTTPEFGPTLEAIAKAFLNSSDCESCYTILNLVKPVALLGDEALAEVTIPLCELSKEYSDLECAGLFQLEAPSVGNALRTIEIPSRPAQIFCEVFLGTCDQPPVLEYTVPVGQPRVKSPITEPAEAPPKVAKKPLQVVHISDLHVDHSYTPGLTSNCSESICCRPGETVKDNATEYLALPYGNYYCDAPLDLETAQFEAIKCLVPDMDFLILTGDIIEGDVWATTDEQVVSHMDSTYSKLLNIVGPSVFPAVGNHDASPVNSFPPAGTNTTYTNTYDYNNDAKIWAPFIGNDTAEQMASNYGSYTAKYADTNLRIISINTIFWEGVNWWVFNTTMSRDPSGVFAWMANVLQFAEDQGERVWVIGHIPPGRSDCLYDYSSYLDQLFERYQDTISSAFWGHTHRDQFEIGYTDYNNRTAANARSIGYIAPSLTPTSGNPNFRVYTVDPDTFGVLDYQVYYANLSSPSYHLSPQWSPYYSAKAAYGSLLAPPYTDPAAELTPAFWHNVTELFAANDTVFQEYYDRKQRGWDYVACEGSCKQDELCQLTSAQSQYACLSPSGAFKKRDGGDGTGARGLMDPDCSHSGLRNVVRGLVERKEELAAWIEGLQRRRV